MGAVFAVGILLKADKANFTAPLDRWVEAGQRQAWWVACWRLRRWRFSAASLYRALGPPWVWESVETLLDRFHKVAFPGETLSYEYRVTLFKGASDGVGSGPGVRGSIRGAVADGRGLDG